MTAADDPQTTALMPGYRAVARLGQSELFDVYDAWSEERECRCVVKVLRAERRDRISDRQAVRREAELLSSLTHPNIIRAYEVRDRPHPFLVLEAATGATLARLIAERPLGMTDLARIAIQLSSALRYLHRRGYLHLDLTPSNIAWGNDSLRLLDLSMARPPGRYTPGLGTAPYRSPEQAAGGPLSEASDVWGLGCVVLEAATGRAPSDDGGGAQRRLDAALPHLHTRVRRTINTLLNRCLTVAPAARPSLDEIARTFAPLG